MALINVVMDQRTFACAAVALVCTSVCVCKAKKELMEWSEEEEVGLGLGVCSLHYKHRLEGEARVCLKSEKQSMKSEKVFEQEVMPVKIKEGPGGKGLIFFSFFFFGTVRGVVTRLLAQFICDTSPVGPT